jgi:outer membrane protein
MKRNAKVIGIVAAGIVIVAALGFVVARSGPALGQSLTIGYVDMVRAVDAHPRKASAEGALKEYAQAQIAEVQQRLKGASAGQQDEIRRQVNTQLLKKRQELIGGLEKDIRAAVEKVAKEQGISIVVNREVILYGGVDLTDQVIKAIGGK